MRATGVDISKYQSDNSKGDWSTPHGVDFKKLIGKAQFLIMRAGYAGSAGGAWVDERIHDYMSDLEQLLRDQPFPFTLYWYFRDDVNIMDQVNVFSAIVNRYKEVINMPLVVDAEVFVKSDAVSTQKIIDFQLEVEKQTGLLVDILYARAWQLNDETTPGLPAYLPHLWIARYSSDLDPQTDQPWGNAGDDPRITPEDYEDWDFWQYDDGGSHGAEYGVVSASIDMNVYNGTQEELREFAKLHEPNDPPVDWDVWGKTSVDVSPVNIPAHSSSLSFFSYDVAWEAQMLSVKGEYGLKLTIELAIGGFIIPLRKTGVYTRGWSNYTFQRDFNFTKSDGVLVTLDNPTDEPMAASVALVLEKYGDI